MHLLITSLVHGEDEEFEAEHLAARLRLPASFTTPASSLPTPCTTYLSNSIVILAHCREPTTLRRCNLSSPPVWGACVRGRGHEYMLVRQVYPASPPSLQTSSHLVTRKRNWPCTFGHVDNQVSRSFLGGVTDESIAPASLWWGVGRDGWVIGTGGRRRGLRIAA